MSRLLSQGTTGADVRAAQDALNFHIQRGTPLKVDGIFGPKTDARVREFQTSNNIGVDGDIGPQTAALLFEVTEFSTVLLLPDSYNYPLSNTGYPLSTSNFPISFLNWKGKGPLPSPFKLLTSGITDVPPGGEGTLPRLEGPMAGLRLNITVPTRYDPKDSRIPAAPEIRLMKEMADNPVGDGTKFKYKLADGTWVVSGPYQVMLAEGGWRGPLPKLTKKVDPKMFGWGISPAWNQAHGIGFSGAAQFMLRWSDGPRDSNGRPTLRIDVGCWGRTVALIGRGIGTKVQPNDRAKVLAEAWCGTVIKF